MKWCGKWCGEENGAVKKIEHNPFYGLVNKLDFPTASTKKQLGKQSLQLDNNR